MEPFLSEPVSQLDPSASPNPTTATHGTPECQYYMRYLLLAATSSSYSLSVPVCLPPCDPFSSCDALFASVRRLLGQAKRKRAPEQSSAAQSSAERLGLRTGAPGHCLILGWRRMPFFAAQTLNITKTAPYRTAPHRIARHRTVPQITLPSGPRAGRPLPLCCCGCCVAQPAFPVCCRQSPSVLPSGRRCQHPQNLCRLGCCCLCCSLFPHCQGPLRCLIPSLLYSTRSCSSPRVRSTARTPWLRGRVLARTPDSIVPAVPSRGATPPRT